MPSIRISGKKGTITFGASDFLSGLFPQYQSSINAPPNFISNQLFVASAFHPYRFLGCASPGFQATDLTNVGVIASHLLNVAQGAESGTSYAYAIEAGEKLHRIDISTKTISNAGIWPHSIVGAGSETGNDVIAYRTNLASVRTDYIFYSWNDSGGAWNVGAFNTATGAFVSDAWLTTVPASPLVASGNNKPHPMIVGADDLLYIADGNLLHSLDGVTGADGTFETTRLTLPSGYIITSMAKLPDYLVIFAYYSPSGNSVALNTVTAKGAVAILWNYLDAEPTYVIPLSDNAVSAGFEFQGTVGCFTQGSKPVQEGQDRFCTLQLFNGSTFEIVQQFIGNPPQHGGIDIIDGSIQWNSDGAVHCYGSPYVGGPQGLNKLNASSGTTSGLLRTIGGLIGFQLISSGATTSGGAQYFAVATFGSSALMQTGAAIPNLPPGTIAKITRVGVKFARVSNVGRTLDAFLVRENAGTIQFISALQDVSATELTAFYDRTVSGGYFGRFDELSLALQWGGGADSTDAPIVREVNVDFEIENLVTSL